MYAFNCTIQNKKSKKEKKSSCFKSLLNFGKYYVILNIGKKISDILKFYSQFWHICESILFL